MSPTYLCREGGRISGAREAASLRVATRLEGIEHRTTRMRSPRTNGFVERMSQLLDECLRVEGPPPFGYSEVTETQGDLHRRLTDCLLLTSS